MDRTCRLHLALAIAAGLAACFPAYEIANGSDAGDSGGAGNADGGDATTSADGAPANDASGDGPGPDGGDASLDAPVDVVILEVGPPPDAMTVVPQGTYGFLLDPQGLGEQATFQDASAHLDYAFAIDDYEVTVGRFRAWVSTGMPLPEAGAPLDPGPYRSVMIWDATWGQWATDTAFVDGGGMGCSPGPSALAPTYSRNTALVDAFPVSCINWFQAVAFCAFEGKRLPTETEWRIVAQGEGQYLTYPWGNSPDPDCSYATMDPDGGCEFPVPVGSASDGVALGGVYDLAGSLSEIFWDRTPQGTEFAYPSGTQTDYYGQALQVMPSDSFVAVESYYLGPQIPYAARGLEAEWTGSLTPAPAVMGFRCAKSM